MSLHQATLIQDAIKLIGRANACGVHYIPYAYCFCPESFLQHIHPHVLISTPEFMVNSPLWHNDSSVKFSLIELLALMVRTDILVDVINVDHSHNPGALMAICCGFKYLSEYQYGYIFNHHTKNVHTFINCLSNSVYSILCTLFECIMPLTT